VRHDRNTDPAPAPEARSAREQPRHDDLRRSLPPASVDEIDGPHLLLQYGQSNVRRRSAAS